MKFTENLSLMLRDTDLGRAELLDLASVYSGITIHSDHLVTLAAAHRCSVAEVYWECVKAQRQIAERVRQLSQREEEQARKENPRIAPRKEMA